MRDVTRTSDDGGTARIVLRFTFACGPELMVSAACLDADGRREPWVVADDLRT